MRLEDIFTGTGVTLPPSAQRRQIVAELAELGSHDTSSDVQTSNEEELPSHGKTPRTIAAAVDMPDLDTITANAVKRAQQLGLEQEDSHAAACNNGLALCPARQ